MQNAFIESCNGKMRDECLNEHWFVSLAVARQRIESWRQDCNEIRPHSSLGNRTPQEFTGGGAAKKEAGRAFGFVRLRLAGEGESVTRQTFTFRMDKEKSKKAERRDGHYLLRSSLVGKTPRCCWERYVQLTQIEAALGTLKSELGLRPIYHQVEKRVEGHVFMAFLAYALSVILKRRLAALAPGLTPRAVLEKLAPIQMLDVCLPTAASHGRG